VFLTPMCEQGFVGTFARPSQAFQFFPRHLEIAYERPFKSLLSSCIQTDRDLVHANQLVAGFAVHNRKAIAKGRINIVTKR